MKVLLMVFMFCVSGCTEDETDYTDNDEHTDTIRIKEVLPVIDDTENENVLIEEPTIAPTIIDDVKDGCRAMSEIRATLGIDNSYGYKFIKNECNSLIEAEFRSNGTMWKVTKSLNTLDGGSGLISIYYNNQGFFYVDSTRNESANGGTQRKSVRYEYLNGDNFISFSAQNTSYTHYTYEGDEQYKYIIENVLYENVIKEVHEITGDYDL